MANSPVTDSIYGMIGQLISYVPTLLAVVILIIVGWLLGRFLGKIGSKLLDKIGLDDLIDRTVIGDMIKKGGMNTVAMFAAIIRWFIYFIFAVIIVDLLDIQVVAVFITRLISYIPLLALALAVLIIGLLIVDFLANLIIRILIATGIDESIMKSGIGKVLKAGGMTGSGIISGLIRLFGYLIFIIAALEILQFRMLTDFLLRVVNYLPSLFTAVAVMIIGLLAIDFLMDYIQATMKGLKVEGTDVMLPALRGFLFLVIILLALDILQIDTGIFYVFLSPLAWGFAVVVAFRWGIKEALVAYARAKQ